MFRHTGGPASHDEPSGWFDSSHAPVVRLQVEVLHTPSGSQRRGAPGLQRPPRHVSSTVHASPSSQEAPSTAGTLTHRKFVEEPQMSVVHELPSSHVAGHLAIPPSAASLPLQT